MNFLKIPFILISLLILSNFAVANLPENSPNNTTQEKVANDNNSNITKKPIKNTSKTKNTQKELPNFAEISSNYQHFLLENNSFTLSYNKNLSNFFNNNYYQLLRDNSLGKKIANQGKFYEKNQIIKQDFITKWQEYSLANNDENQFNLTAVKLRNSKNNWKNNFVKYQNLILAINGILLKNNVDQISIDEMLTTFLWQFKANNLPIMVFNLYNFSPKITKSNSYNLINVNSLTAIAVLKNGKWQIQIIDAIFNQNIKPNISYFGGHKKLILWDLYQDEAKNFHLIFKVEDEFREYLELYKINNLLQNNFSLQLVYRHEDF